MEDLTLDDLYLEFNTSYFPPAKRDRIQKLLKAAGKLRMGKSRSLEIIQEKFELEAHILNKTVIVDDGSERKVYSSCAFEGVKRYNCNVCVVAIFGKTSLIRHNCSKKHYYMMQNTTHPHQNFDDHQIINLDPVPLFPKEGQVVPEAGAQSKKKKKKTKHSSSSRSPKRKRSSSSISSQSLSPVARQRRLSPEPGPSSRYLPDELMSPPVVVREWLNSFQETELLNHSMTLISSCQLTKESIREFFSKCNEENWEKRTHDCCPYLSSTCRLKEALKNDEVFYDLRRFFIVLWLKEKMVRGNGWTLEQLNVADSKFRNMAKIMETGRLCTRVCRPLCRNLVEAMVHCVLADFPEAKEMTEEEVMISCRGLINLSNWLHLIWSSIPKTT